ncbi:MAG: hypothetical protein ACI94Y_002536 [Maribacter sp.]|jgi:hypothetical protein
MKSIKFILAVAMIGSLLFPSCEKEKNPNDKGPMMIIGEIGRYKPSPIPVINPNPIGCEWGGVLCPQRTWSDFEPVDLEHLELISGQVAGTGQLTSSNGNDVLDFNFTRHDLSEEATHRLINEGVMEMTNHEFDENLVKELYDQAGVEYNEVPVMIEAGLYEVQVMDNGDGVIPDPAAISINITITYEDGRWEVETSISW